MADGGAARIGLGVWLLGLCFFDHVVAWLCVWTGLVMALAGTVIFSHHTISLVCGFLDG